MKNNGKNNLHKFTKAQRMQMKAFLCVLGFLLIAVLLLGRLILALVHRGEEEDVPQPPPPIPVVQLYTNVWVLEAGQEELVIFRDGVRESYPWETAEGEERHPEPGEYLADVELTDGRVTMVKSKTDRINGRILGAGGGVIEVEGYGKLPLAPDYKGYRLYDGPAMCSAADLLFGYAFTDLCIENGEVCGVLMVKEEAMEYIRVLIKTEDYNGLFHDRPVLTCDTAYTVVYGPYDNQKTETHEAGEELTLDYDGSYFEADRVWVIPDVLTGKITLENCGRSQGTPSYRGRMEFLKTEDGIVAVNEVLLEEYLYSVVPSEMPSAYPAEALRAQAVCARTYAYISMLQAGYPQYGAHVDDSTSFQVYNNIVEQESTTAAVRETFGQLLLTPEGKPAGTYYYSTSCGVGSDATVWKTEAAASITYLKSKALNRAVMAGSLPDGGQEAGEIGERLRDEAAFDTFIRAVNPEDFEAEEGWYRWSYQVEKLDTDHMLEVLQRRYAANSNLILSWKENEYVSEEIRELGSITDLYIEKRGSGGVAEELVIVTDTGKIKVISEHNIRYVLNDGSAEVERQDGSRIASPNLLPSGFFVISTGKESGSVVNYSLTGGGFGHGAGMSQNGAKAMALDGYTAAEILSYFYEGCRIENIYE